MRIKPSALLYISLACNFAGLQAQTKKIDTVYRPKTFDVQVRQFEIYPDSPEDVIFLGNSITSRAQWNELLGLPNARNRGISGDTTFGILERLHEVTEGRPAQIFLLIGINDISRNVPDALILRNYETIIDRIQKESPATRLVVQTILPVNPDFGEYERHYHKDGHIAAVNAGIRELADAYGLTLIDLHPLFLDPSGKLKVEYTDEGLHLNEKGYLHWASILRPHVEKGED